ncbi:uncharacterized protein GGS25DRAFT_493695 [Hypoxylon fragiforme]|uniref:uncharacterized protein n=1 Tax=Hypoxylon fragiforme TaxID=63214 RepID=UPI0020C600AD|nr:uncharacterized protein GGS25DRAFT_493695 [Hypoxylon fragiforme]KAI2606897.1 hypothetical protein GGS25DRAFT_493695 [Hypoxylon fragiforme]
MTDDGDDGDDGSLCVRACVIRKSNCLVLLPFFCFLALFSSLLDTFVFLRLPTLLLLPLLLLLSTSQSTGGRATISREPASRVLFISLLFIFFFISLHNYFLTLSFALQCFC